MKEIPLRRLVLDACDGPFGSAIKSEHYADEGARVIRLGNIGTGTWRDEGRAFLSLDYWRELEGHHAIPGDVVVAGLGDEGNPVGRACVVPDEVERGLVKADCYRLRLDPRRADPRFVAAFLSSRAGLAQSEALAEGATRPRLTLGKALALRVPEVQLATQRVVCDYLDTETARIDALIAKKLRIAELAEQRFLVSVRQKLLAGCNVCDPLNVESREVVSTSSTPSRLSWRFQFGSGTTPRSGDQSYYDDNGIPWVVTGDLRDKSIESVYRGLTPEAFSHYPALTVYPEGSLIVAMYGATIGRLGLLRLPAAVNQACCVLVPQEDYLSEYVFYWLLGFRDQLVERGRGAGQPNISQELLRSLRIPFPNPDIRHILIREIDAERSHLNALTHALRSQITLLMEHRQALITAAVTGELDVAGRSGRLAHG